MVVFTADQIEQFVEELTELKKTQTQEQIDANTKYDEFRIQNKIFYEMILSPLGVDKTIFKEMMKMKRRLENGETQYDVDVRFGQFMATKYLDPVVKKL